MDGLQPLHLLVLLLIVFLVIAGITFAVKVIWRHKR